MIEADIMVPSPGIFSALPQEHGALVHSRHRFGKGRLGGNAF